jgi:hypothetical protein
MKKGILGIAGLALASTGLQAQVGSGVGGGFGVGRSGSGAPGAMIEQFQQAGTMVAASGDRVVMPMNTITTQTVLGRPVSGTEVQKSTQTLGDGTEISTSENQSFYRDSAGRTRREMAEGRTVIVDPVARVSVTLIAGTKMARRMAMPGGAELPPKLAAVISDRQVTTGTASTSATYTFDIGEKITTVTTGSDVVIGRAGRGGRGNGENVQRENLGVESLNGVLATHTRNTLTIPQGQIGNNRDIHVVNERWYSDDLQMLVKTLNSDPRFGENTYEFTNITRDEPDSSLFQIPPDYTITDVGAGRALPAAPPATINK